jgi:hypothetical protein
LSKKRSVIGPFFSTTTYTILPSAECIFKSGITFEPHEFHLQGVSPKGERVLTIDRCVMAIAGSFIVISVVLAAINSLYWLYFTAFVGINLFQSAFTGFCPLAMVMKKFGIKTGAAFS